MMFINFREVTGPNEYQNIVINSAEIKAAIPVMLGGVPHIGIVAAGADIVVEGEVDKLSTLLESVTFTS